MNTKRILSFQITDDRTGDLPMLIPLLDGAPETAGRIRPLTLPTACTGAPPTFPRRAYQCAGTVAWSHVSISRQALLRAVRELAMR